MEKYNRDKDLGAVVETLKLSVGLTAISSPLDSSLSNQRKKTQKKKKEEEKVDLDENDVGLTECELGNSPVILPNNFKKNKQN